MSIFLLILLLAIAAVGLVPTLLLRKQGKTTWWDWIHPFTGVIAWFPLAVFEVGSKVTLSNFAIEVLAIALLSAVIPWARLLLSRWPGGTVRLFSILLTFLPILSALLLRLTMPTLSE